MSVKEKNKKTCAPLAKGDATVTLDGTISFSSVYFEVFSSQAQKHVMRTSDL